MPQARKRISPVHVNVIEIVCRLFKGRSAIAIVSVLTDSQTVIPPIVRTLIKLQVMIIRDHFRVRRRADRPRAEIDQHHQQYRHHPLQQLLVGQLDFVSALYTIRKRDSANETFVFASAIAIGLGRK